MPRFAPLRVLLDLGLDEPRPRPVHGGPGLRALRLGLGTALLLFVLILLTGCKEETVAVEPDPVVRTTLVTLAPDREVRSYVGVIRPRHDVEEAFRVGGRMVARAVEVGDRVEDGQTLAKLDPRDFILAVESAEAELAAAQAAVEQTGADEVRFRKLRKKGFTSEAEFSRRKLAADEARSRLERAENALAQARNQRTYATLVSSGDGVVTAIHADRGQVVAQGQRIVSIARLDEKEIAVAIPESRLGDLDASRAEVTLWSGGEPQPAKLREVAPQADPQARTYAARFSLPGAGKDVRLGMSATLSLISGSEEPVARLPLSAVLNQGKGAAVFVVDPQTRGLRLTPVEVVRWTGSEAVIGGGLKTGDQVVTLGVHKLDEGLTVRVAEAR